MRRTKIIATYGPSLHRHLAEACKKVDVIRVNFSHNNEETWAAMKEHVVRTIKDSGRKITLLADLPGPKVRVGLLDESIHVKTGEEVCFGYAQTKLDGFVPVNYEGLYRDAKKGATIIIGDGEPRFRIERILGKKIYATALANGAIGSKKGVSLSGASISLPVPTVEDIRLADFLAGEGFGWMAISFVRDAAQVDELRKHAGKDSIVSKIERREAIENIDEIAKRSDILMVARGDLGLDMKMEEVPMAQRKIIEAAKRHRKPVIIATQVLTSMIENPIPTRAEVNDIASGVLSGADYIMLSDETTIGKHPLEAIDVLDRVITEIEKY
jgi:pyruvate kinase